MVDFNADIPNGLPKLDKDYWTKQNNNADNQLQNPLFENDLSKISVFNGNKK